AWNNFRANKADCGCGCGGKGKSMPAKASVPSVKPNKFEGITEDQHAEMRSNVLASVIVGGSTLEEAVNDFVANAMPDGLLDTDARQLLQDAVRSAHYKYAYVRAFTN